MMFRADLHCHTTCSDGTFMPADLMAKAADIGLSGLSYTDHDTISAYTPEIFDVARKNSIKLLTGTELSTLHRETCIHVLGYAFPLPNPILEEVCQERILRRFERSRKIFELLARNGMRKGLEEYVSGAIKITGRPLIARILIEHGYVETVREAFNRYLADGMPCYCRMGGLSTQQAIDAIHKAGGKAVLAQPHLIRPRKVSKSLMSMNFDGIEGYYARFPLTAEQEWLDIANEKGWIVTGGSDFHGDDKPNNILGSSWVREKAFSFFYEHFITRSELF